MSKDKLDVVCVGNAIVDVLSQVTDDFLSHNKINKGTMTLIEPSDAKEIYSKLGPGVEVSGGSAANTAVALSSMGGKGGFIGKVAEDQLGEVFTHDIRSTGVEFASVPMAINNIPTSHCLVMVTPDAERTMCTSLGASTYITAVDINKDMIENSQVTYLEGYLFDKPEAKEAFKKIAGVARAAGKKIALTLSDPFCVERHRKDFLDLIENEVDILFANEEEIKSLYKKSEFPTELPKCKLAVITRSEKGSVIISEKETITVECEKVDRVVDTTGAGDLYAAGFLYGYTQGKSLAECGRIGSIMAAEIIAHLGARPQRSLSQLLKDKKAA